MAKRSRAVLKSDVLAQEVAALHESKGRTPAEARDLVILEWLLKGDVGPFKAWFGKGIADGSLSAIIANPRAAVLGLIADMLKGDADLSHHLVIRRGRGQPERAGLPWRDYIIARKHTLHRESVGSEIAYTSTANDFGISETAVRLAVKRYRQLQLDASNRSRATPTN